MSPTATAVLAATVAIATSQIPTSTTTTTTTGIPGGTMPYLGASPVSRRKLSSYENGEEFDKCISIADWKSKTPSEDIDLFDREAAGCCPRGTIPGAPYGNNPSRSGRFGPRVVCGFKGNGTLEFWTGPGEDGYGVDLWANPEAINTCSFNQCYVIKQDAGCEVGGVNFLNGCCPNPTCYRNNCGFLSGCEVTVNSPIGAYREGGIKHCFLRSTLQAWVGTPDKSDDWSDGKLVVDKFERYASCPEPAAVSSTTTTTATPATSHSGTSRPHAPGCVRIPRSMLEGLASLGFRPEAHQHPGACPVPAESFTQGGKDCPCYPSCDCLAGNKGHATFAEAWTSCGNYNECSFIMRYWDGKYYLRRDSDPGFSGNGCVIMQYSCPARRSCTV